jgi:phosphoribosylglycinamide formyltransferase 1
MSATPALALAIVISGRGSNMVAIARACASGQLRARVAGVIADRQDAGGIALARELRLPVAVVAAREFPDREAFEGALRTAIEASGAQLVILAGFMRILSPRFTQVFAGRMLNIHPSLLPRFPGLHTHERALQEGAAEHGATVHFVTADLDAGPLVLQARVAVRPGDTPAALAARVQRCEHIIYPRVIGWIADGRLKVRDGTAHLDGTPLTRPLLVDESALAPSPAPA